MTHPIPAAMVALHGLVEVAVDTRTVRVDLGPMTDFEEPDAIDALERSRGETLGRPRVKLVTWDELLDAAEAVAAET